MAASFNKFNSWVDYMVEGANLASDQFVVALTAAANAPIASNTVLANLTQATYTNCSSRNLSTLSSSQTSGTYSLVLDDLTLTASGGSVGPFRYVVIYDDTVTGDPLVGWYDYGSDITLASGETLAITFGSSLFTVA